MELQDVQSGADVVGPNPDLLMGPDTVDVISTPDAKMTDLAVTKDSTLLADSTVDGALHPSSDVPDATAQLPDVASDPPADLLQDLPRISRLMLCPTCPAMRHHCLRT